jgi:hypothetical protein
MLLWTMPIFATLFSRSMSATVRCHLSSMPTAMRWRWVYGFVTSALLYIVTDHCMTLDFT